MGFCLGVCGGGTHFEVAFANVGFTGFGDGGVVGDGL